MMIRLAFLITLYAVSLLAVVSPATLWAWHKAPPDDTTDPTAPGRLLSGTRILGAMILTAATVALLSPLLSG